ncbi:MAG TPA: hypothetical protein ENJ42_06800, partial [Hellea balneolensis]|nr:hypothetical protein [Hellea balneolensis]
MSQKPIQDKPQAQKNRRLGALGAKMVQYGLEAVSDMMSFAGIWLIFLGVLISRGQIDLTPFKPRIEGVVTKAFDGETADIAKYQAKWLQDDQQIRVIVEDVKIAGKQNSVQKIERISANFEIFPNLWDMPDISQIEFEGGELTLERLKTGAIQFGLGRPSTYKVLVGDLAKVLKSDTSRSLDMFEALKSIDIDGGRINLIDNITGTHLTLKAVRGRIHIGENQIELVLRGDNLANSVVSPFAMDIRLKDSGQQIEGVFQINNLNPMTV